MLGGCAGEAPRQSAYLLEALALRFGGTFCAPPSLGLSFLSVKWGQGVISVLARAVARQMFIVDTQEIPQR